MSDIIVDLSKCKPIAVYIGKPCKPAPNCKECGGTGTTSFGRLRLKCICSIAFDGVNHLERGGD